MRRWRRLTRWSYIDIRLPDLKYYSSELSARYSAAPDYFPFASAAVKRMIEHTGPLVLEDFSENGQTCQLMKRGVILRHMVLRNTKTIPSACSTGFRQPPGGHFLVSLMSQYTPSTRAANIRKSTAASQATNTRKSSMPRLSWGSRRALCRKKQRERRIHAAVLSCRGFDIYIRKNPFLMLFHEPEKGYR